MDYKSKNPIVWRSESVVSTASGWTYNGAHRDNTDIEIFAQGSISIQIPLNMTPTNNCKLVCRVQCSNSSYTTENDKKVACVATIRFKQSNNNSVMPQTECFYPCYIDEQKYDTDTYIFSLAGNDLDSISLQVHNFEDVSIRIKSIAVIFDMTDSQVAEQNVYDNIYAYTGMDLSGGSMPGGFNSLDGSMGIKGYLVIPYESDYADFENGAPPGAVCLIDAYSNNIPTPSTPSISSSDSSEQSGGDET